MGFVIIATGHRHHKGTTAAGLRPIAAAPYDANLAAAFQTAPYDARVAKGPPPLAPHNQNPKPANGVAGLGCQRGNVATNYDAQLAIWQKTLRHHFSHSYDVNLARNSYDRSAVIGLKRRPIASLRCQCGRPPKARRLRRRGQPGCALRKNHRLGWQCGKTAKQSPPNRQAPGCIAAVRWVRSYSVNFYDANLGNTAKSLRRQSGHFYDQKKVRNNYPATVPPLKPNISPFRDRPFH